MPSDEPQPTKGIRNTPLTRRQVLGGVAAVTGAAALGPVMSACGNGESSTGGSASPSAAAGPKKGGQLRAGITTGSAKDSFDPHALAYEPEIASGFQLYNGLMAYSPDYQLEKILAEEVTPNADATVWTVRIKPDVVYSDGAPVTADDVVFSINRIIDPKNPKNSSAMFTDLKPNGIKKIDDKTVEFTLEKPNAIFYEALASRESNIVRSDFDVKNPIGTGPFKLKSYTPGQQIVFVPNENYWGEGPYVDELTIIEFADPLARVNALLSGAIDIADQMVSAQLKTITSTPGYASWETKSGGYFPFTMRIDAEPFTDVRVRQAFRLIVDRAQMISQAYDELGWLGNDMYAPFDPGYPKDLPQREQDLEQAKSLLKQAGQENMAIDLNTSDAVGAGAVNAATVFAQQAKGAGVNVKVVKHDSNVFYGDQYLQWVFAMDYWGTRNYLAQTSMGEVEGAPYNETHWPGPYQEWQKLVDEAWRTVDDVKRNELITEAATFEHDNGGLILWSFNVLTDGYSDKLGGLVHDVFQSSAMGFRYHLVYFK
jgi:peptide/nickel transport system substrate-binding protein